LGVPPTNRNLGPAVGQDVPRPGTPTIPAPQGPMPQPHMATGPETLSGPNRRTRLRLAAAARGVPLPTILATVGIVAGVYLFGLLAFKLRDIVLLIVIAGFIAVVLNPLVLLCQRWGLRRRGPAVVVVVAVASIAFLATATAFGYPLSNALAHLAHQLPSYVAAAEQGHGFIGRLERAFDLRKWVTANSPKLQQIGDDLAKPAIAVGKGAVTLIGQMLAVLTLVVLLLLEGSRIRAGLLGMLSPDHAAWCEQVATDMRQAVSRFVLGNLITSLTAGIVVGVTMLVLGLPFPLLWALWVALVDFLPQVGGAIAGIPAVLFAAMQSLTDAAILAAVFLIYQGLENHILNPVILSRTVRTSPLLVFVSVLVGVAIGAWIGGTFGAFFVALLAVPAASSIQVLVREIWRTTAGTGTASPDQPATSHPSNAKGTL
jgi:predicted PurR-regulated permease PerM